MKKSAFTLIELLVVISIIAVLASIAVPVFGKAMEKGKATNCAANMRQLGIGMAAYLNDNEDQMFPKAGGGAGANSGPWPQTLHGKYITNWKVYRSPFDKRVDRDRPPDVPVSYGINENLFASGGFNGSAAKFAYPSQLIMMAPALNRGANTVVFSGNSEQSVELQMPSGAGKDFGTHSGRSQINVLYADTHVSALKYKEFAENTGEEGQRRWMPEGGGSNATP